MQEVKGNASHRILVISIFAVVVLILISVGYLFYAAKKVSISSELNPSDDLSSNEQILSLCLNSCRSCEQNCNDNFFFENAKTKDDETLCDKIQNDFVKSECKDSFTLAKAIASLDLTLCGSLREDKKFSCVYSVSLSKAVSTDDVSLCNYLNDSAQDCVDNFYFQKKLCSDIVNGDLKQACIDLLNLDEENDQ